MKSVISLMNAFLKNVILDCERGRIGKRYVSVARAKTARAGRPLSEDELLQIKTDGKQLKVIQVSFVVVVVVLIQFKKGMHAAH
jgi:hypothetical protein